MALWVVSGGGVGGEFPTPQEGVETQGECCPQGCPIKFVERGVLGEFIFALCQQSRGEWEPPVVGSALQPFDASAEIGQPGSALEWVR